MGDAPHGATVSAFLALSLEPPLVLVSLHHGSRVLAAARETGRFGINVLAHNQRELAMHFARPQAEKFAGIPWTLDRGVPRLSGPHGWLVATVERAISAGDHELLLGLIEHLEILRHDPLLYRRRRFATLVERGA
jgi:flavin reductase (DIM6/NTAB) family NADH-FMN oxidoreductase RutF